LTFTSHAFHPKAECLPDIDSFLFDVAGLLAYSLFNAFPSCVIKTVACGINNLAELTATGIAPELHRISLFIPTFRVRKPNRSKCRERSYYCRNSFQQRIYFLL